MACEGAMDWAVLKRLYWLEIEAMVAGKALGCLSCIASMAIWCSSSEVYVMKEEEDF
jgi:hypothetical protein